MGTKTKVAIAAVVLAGLATVPAVANSGDDPGEQDTPIAGASLERASAAALAHVGGGRVTGTEVEDEESYYEVEVTLEDGSQVDVQLDEDFTVVGSEGDGRGDDGADD